MTFPAYCDHHERDMSVGYIQAKGGRCKACRHFRPNFQHWFWKYAPFRPVGQVVPAVPGPAGATISERLGAAGDA